MEELLKDSEIRRLLLLNVEGQKFFRSRILPVVVLGLNSIFIVDFLHSKSSLPPSFILGLGLMISLPLNSSLVPVVGFMKAFEL